MHEVITDLTTSAINLEAIAKQHRADRKHISATRIEKMARNYCTAIKLLTLIYPRKK